MDSSIPNCIINWLKTLPWSTLIVGIVVPVASAYISYRLAESSIRRKENNRLNVYIAGKWGQVLFPTIKCKMCLAGGRIRMEPMPL